MVSKLAAKLVQDISKGKSQGDNASIVPPLPLFGRREVISGSGVPSPRPLERKRYNVRKCYKTCLAEIVSAFQSQKSRAGVTHSGKQSTSTTASPMLGDILQSEESTESSTSPEYQEHGFAVFPPVSKCGDLVVLGGVDEKLTVASMEAENFGIMPTKECERPSIKEYVQTNDNINILHNDDGGSWYLADLESIRGGEEPVNNDKMSSAPPSVPRHRQSRVSRNRSNANYSPRSDLESTGSGSKQKNEPRSLSSTPHRRRLSRQTSTRHLDVNDDDTLRSSGSHHRRRSRRSLSCRNLLSSPSTALGAGAKEQEDVSKAISSKSSNQQSERDDATSDESALESRLGRIQSCDPSRSTRSRVVDWRKKAEGFEELLDDLRVSSTEFRSHVSKEKTAEGSNDEKDSKENLQNSGNGKGRRRGNSLWTYREGPPTPACHDDGGSRPALTRQRSIKCLHLSDNEDDMPPMSSSFFKKHSIRRRG